MLQPIQTKPQIQIQPYINTQKLNSVNLFANLYSAANLLAVRNHINTILIDITTVPPTIEDNNVNFENQSESYIDLKSQTGTGGSLEKPIIITFIKPIEINFNLILNKPLRFYLRYINIDENINILSIITNEDKELYIYIYTDGEIGIYYDNKYILAKDYIKSLNTKADIVKDLPTLPNGITAGGKIQNKKMINKNKVKKSK